MASSPPLETDTPERAAAAAVVVAPEKPMLRRRRGPRCQLCKRQHQKCRFTHDGDVCDRCLSLGYECRLLVGTERRPTPPVRAPRAKRGSNIFKCDACRQHHQKCEPEDRVWPARCLRCVKQKEPCSPPRDALGRDIPYVRNNGGGSDPPGGDRALLLDPEPSWPSPPFPVVARADPENARSAADSSDGSATVPTAAWREQQQQQQDGGVGASPPPVGKGHHHCLEMMSSSRNVVVAAHGETIRRMEDEFHDVLRQLETRHARELRAQKDGYEEELRAQRDRYEQRLDDLIRVLRNMGQGH